jgi:hypothetical protein
MNLCAHANHTLDMQYLVALETLRILQRHIFQSQSSRYQACHKECVAAQPFVGTEDILAFEVRGGV